MAGHWDNTETGLLRVYPPKAPNTFSPSTCSSLSPSSQIKEDKGLSFPETHQECSGVEVGYMNLNVPISPGHSLVCGIKQGAIT